MTKLERAKYKKLVDKLKRHRQQGELNLVIKKWLYCATTTWAFYLDQYELMVRTSVQTSPSPNTPMATDGDSQNS